MNSDTPRDGPVRIGQLRLPQGTRARLLRWLARDAMLFYTVTLAPVALLVAVAPARRSRSVTR